jgi:hypothetical protein
MFQKHCPDLHMEDYISISTPKGLTKKKILFYKANEKVLNEILD